MLMRLPIVSCLGLQAAVGLLAQLVAVHVELAALGLRSEKRIAVVVAACGVVRREGGE